MRCGFVDYAMAAAMFGMAGVLFIVCFAFLIGIYEYTKERHSNEPST